MVKKLSVLNFFCSKILRNILYDLWCIGKITWYNKKFNEYRVEFDDGEETDYINLMLINHYVDGVEIILLEE